LIPNPTPGGPSPCSEARNISSLDINLFDDISGHLFEAGDSEEFLDSQTESWNNYQNLENDATSEIDRGEAVAGQDLGLAALGLNLLDCWSENSVVVPCLDSRQESYFITYRFR